MSSKIICLHCEVKHPAGKKGGGAIYGCENTFTFSTCFLFNSNDPAMVALMVKLAGEPPICFLYELSKYFHKKKNSILSINKIPGHTK